MTCAGSTVFLFQNVNNLDYGWQGNMFKFADDGKLGTMVNGKLSRSRN